MRVRRWTPVGSSPHPRFLGHAAPRYVIWKDAAKIVVQAGQTNSGILVGLTTDPSDDYTYPHGRESIFLFVISSLSGPSRTLYLY